MATIEHSPAARSTLDNDGRLFTVADLAAMPSELPSGPVRYELDNGRLVMMSPTGGEHGGVESRITGILFTHGEMPGFGRVYSGEAGLILWRSPDRVVGMDASFFRAGSLPLRTSPEGYIETIPDLVAEVVSKNDSRAYVQRKVDDYLKVGVRVVWIVNPLKQAVAEHRPGVEVRTYAVSDTLTLEDVVPGLRIRLDWLFER